MNLASILVALFIVSMIVVASINKQSQKLKMANFFNIVIALVLVLSAAIRSELVGSDTPNYIDDYEMMRNASLSSIVTDYSSLSLVYYVASWVACSLGVSRWFWFGIVEAFYIFSALAFINKFSKDRVFSFFCFVTIGLFFPSFNIMKQTVAMSFAMLSFISFVDKKRFAAVVLYILGLFTHQSILLFLLAYIVYFFKDNKRAILVLSIAIIIVGIIGGTLWGAIIGGYGSEHYSMYEESDEAYSNVTFIYFITLFIIAFIIKKRYVIQNKSECLLFTFFSLFACVMQSLSTSFSIAHRLAYYYLPFMVLLIPNEISYMNNRFTKLLFQLLFVGMMSFFLIYTQREVPYIVDLRILNML